MLSRVMVIVSPGRTLVFDKTIRTGEGDVWTSHNEWAGLNVVHADVGAPVRNAEQAASNAQSAINNFIAFLLKIT